MRNSDWKRSSELEEKNMNKLRKFIFRNGLMKLLTKSLVKKNINTREDTGKSEKQVHSKIYLIFIDDFY